MELYFPARSGCAFSEDPNLDPRNEHIQARVEESESVDLPLGASVCGLTMASDERDLQFDDHLAILLDDVVLVSGGSGLALEDHPVVDGLPRFDWTDVRGRPFSDRYAPYQCLGESTCSVPATERSGALTVDIDEATMTLVAHRLPNPTQFQVRLLTFGDNDGGDCAHTDLTVQLAVRYSDAEL